LKGYTLNKPRNSFEAVKFVIDHAPKDLTHAQRLVLIQIAHHYPNPHISHQALAAEIGIKRRDTVIRCIKVLVERELLISKRQGHMRANKYELNIGLTVHAETVHMMPRQTVHNVPRETVLKQTSLKKENKAFFDFLGNFPNMTVDEAKVQRAWTKALLKGTSEDLLVTASQANREMLEPDAWLNFEKWKSYKPVVDEIAELRKRSI
jgi:hypothetical protein